MIFYFTGTGNSLYAAKMLDKSTISIPQVIKQEELNFIADSIGIVCPIYGHEMPRMVKEFIRKAHFFSHLLLCGADLWSKAWRCGRVGTAVYPKRG